MTFLRFLTPILSFMVFLPAQYLIYNFISHNKLNIYCDTESMNSRNQNMFIFLHVGSVFGYPSEQHVIQLAQQRFNARPMSQTLAQLLANGVPASPSSAWTITHRQDVDLYRTTLKSSLHYTQV